MPGQPHQRPDLRWVAIGVAAAGLGAVALASRGSGVFGRLQDGTSPFGSTAARAGVGALGGLVLGLGVAALFRATNGRHRLIGSGAGRPAWKRALRWSLPVVILLGALGAAAGAATAPLHPRQASGGRSGEPSSAARASLVDLDRDGQPDRDANGELLVAVDMGGDGDFDAVLRPCPDRTFGSSEELEDPQDRRPRVAVDSNCDGKVDHWIRLQDGLIDDMARPEISTELGGGEEAERQPIDRSPDVAQGVKSVSVLLLVLGGLGALVLLWRALRRRSGRVPLLPPADAPHGVPSAGIDRDAAAATLDSTISVMLRDPDPRRAILAAYATLLEGWAGAGLPRREHEAPREHLERCLGALAVRPDPMRDLVDVFLLVRFSTHPIDESYRSEALAALREAQADLARSGAPVGAGQG